jgi:hypothetical protein
MLRTIIDPHTTLLRAPPREERDLVIAATNAWVIAYDNLSSIPDWLSDALSRLATGTGFGTRELYSDDEEKIFTAARPIVVNGIEEVITAPDLTDRAILIELAPIDDKRRQDERALWDAFDAAWPRLLGGVLTAVSAALRHVDSTRLARRPRMADFALWVTAAASGLGWPSDRFIDAYQANRATAHESTLEAALVGPPFREHIEANGGRWAGRLKDLLEALEGRVKDEYRKQKGWPRTSRGLRGALTRLAPTFRGVGIAYTFTRELRTNLATIEITPVPVTPPDEHGPGGGPSGTLRLSMENTSDTSGSPETSAASGTYSAFSPTARPSTTSGTPGSVSGGRLGSEGQPPQHPDNIRDISSSSVKQVPLEYQEVRKQGEIGPGRPDVPEVIRVLVPKDEPRPPLYEVENGPDQITRTDDEPDWITYREGEDEPDWIANPGDPSEEEDHT